MKIINGQYWFDAAELAGKPGMPARDKDVNVRWGKDRPRQARAALGLAGKGWLYPESALPEATQDYFRRQRAVAEFEQSPDAQVARAIGAARRAAEAQQAEAERLNAEARLALFAQATGTKRQRAEAWLDVYTAWQRYFRAQGAPGKKAAMAAFVALFNAQDAALGVSAATFSVVAQSSGRGRCGTLTPTPPPEGEGLFREKGLSVRTLERKVSSVESSGIGSLCDHYQNRRKGKNTINTQPRLEAFVLGLMGQQPDISPVRIYELAGNHFSKDSGVVIPSSTCFVRYVQDWKRRHANTFLFMQNPDAWKNSVLPAVGDADGDVERLNQRWEFDSTQGDILLSDGRRHAVIGAIDIWSRRGKLLVAPTSKGQAIGCLVRRALLDWGVAEEAKTDNGKDYTGHYLTGVFESLNIKHTLCPPFTPEMKPHIERFLGTFNHDLVELLPGYVGHDVAERKSIEARRSFASRLMEKDGVLEVRMSPEEFQNFCDNWVENHYNRKQHSALGMSPFEKAVSWREKIKRIENPRALDILLAPMVDGQTRSIGKKGLEIGGGFYSAPELWTKCNAKEKVEVRIDETDLGQVYVFKSSGEFVCIAICPERLGLSPAEIQAHAARCKQAALAARKEELKPVREAKKTVSLPDQVSDFLRAKGEDAATVVPLRRPGEAHTSPGLEAAGKAAALADGQGDAPLPAEVAQALEKQRLARARQAEQPVAEVRQWLPAAPWEKYLFWKRLDERLRQGEALTEQEIRFHGSFPQSPDYKAMRRKEEAQALAGGNANIAAA